MLDVLSRAVVSGVDPMSNLVPYLVAYACDTIVEGSLMGWTVLSQASYTPRMVTAPALSNCIIPLPEVPCVCASCLLSETCGLLV